MDEIRKEVLDSNKAADIFLGEPIFEYNYQDEKAATVIDISSFFSLLETERWGSYNGTRSNKTRYLLLKLDLIIGNPSTQLSYNKAFSSIEHLMPQKIDPKYWNVDQDDHKQWLHKLGNLVLVDRRKNSAFGNIDFKSKKTKYETAIESRANTSYVFMHYSDWSVQSITDNHNRVIKLLKDYYIGNSYQTLITIRKKFSN